MLAVFTVLVSSTAGAESVKKCLVDKIQFENDGSYIVKSVKLWKDDGSGKQERPGAGSKALTQDQTTRFVLKNEATLSNGTEWLSPGDEVWIRAVIRQSVGTAESGSSCRKDKHKLIYAPDNGRTMYFHTEGGTQTGNRCKYTGKMDQDCYTGSSD